MCLYFKRVNRHSVTIGGFTAVLLNGVSCNESKRFEGKLFIIESRTFVQKQQQQQQPQQQLQQQPQQQPQL